MSSFGADIEESLEHALMLRDRLRNGSVDDTKQARSLCSKVYPEAAGSDALPAAVDQLLGECSACNLHTAIALVSKMRALGIRASSNQLVMQPTVALERRKQQQCRQQIAFGSWPLSKTGQHKRDHVAVKRPVSDDGWGGLTPDLVLKVAELLDDRDILVMGCACAGWRDVLDRSVRRMCFTWAGHNFHPDYVNGVVRGAALLLRQLESVSLRRATHLSDSALACLAKSCGPHLKEVDLSGCQCLTDAGIASLARYCPNLRAIDVSSGYGLTDRAFSALATCRELRTVNACGCDRLSDNGLCALVNGTRKLRELNLGWCERVTEIGLQAVAHCCPDMEMLDLCGCNQVRDVGLIALAETCTGLTSLGLHCCRRLTDASMAVVATNLHKLTSLNVSGCLPMSCSAVQAVVDANPGLHTCRSFQRTVIIGGCLSLLGVRCKCKRHTLW
ncbi:probable f-box/LRR-repeat protein 2 [Coccomyxa sp. Obi]|nr:probable f-box/LRR-repeat protein 2 [Coccomyxa sp. Obi]